MYRDLFYIKSSKYGYSTNKSMGISIGILVLSSIIIVASNIGVFEFIGFQHVLAPLICGAIDTGLICLNVPLCTKINDKISFNDFKKKHPNINTDVDANELEKALTKTEELCKLQNMEEKKERFSTLHSDEYNKMSTEEQINVLNEEIEYLGQVMIEEKNKNDSTRDSAKVLKKIYNSNKQ